MIESRVQTVPTTPDMPEPAVRSSAFFIPTNRECGPAIRSYRRELEYAWTAFGRRIPLVVSETNDGPEAGINAAALAAIAAEHPDQETLHLTVPRQHLYFEALLAGETPRLSTLFAGGRRDYGTAMNKIYLMTGSLGADALHRRDSDTTLLGDELPVDRGRFPIEIELANLGHRVSAMRAGRRSVHIRQSGDPRICVVGGNYYGEWNLDVKDLASRSYSIVERLYVLLGFEADTVAELCAEIFPREQRYFAEDELTLVAKVNDGPNADCGNVAITGVHELLPNVPGRNMLAADYFTFDLSTSLGIPSLHHTRAVFHQYTETRFEYDSKLGYWEGVLRFADYFNLYGPMFEHRALGAAADDDPVITPDSMHAIKDAVSALPGSDRSVRRERLESIAREILLPLGDGYALIAEHLSANVGRYLDECDQDYRDHHLLLDRWPVLVDRAKSIDLRKFAAA
jgi:hypothetical protein